MPISWFYKYFIISNDINDPHHYDIEIVLSISCYLHLKSLLSLLLLLLLLFLLSA